MSLNNRNLIIGIAIGIFFLFLSGHRKDAHAWPGSCDTSLPPCDHNTEGCTRDTSICDCGIPPSGCTYKKIVSCDCQNYCSMDGCCNTYCTDYTETCECVLDCSSSHPHEVNEPTQEEPTPTNPPHPTSTPGSAGVHSTPTPRPTVTSPPITLVPTFTPTPTSGSQCGETCDPSIPNVCEQEECLVCGIPPDNPESQPICMSCNCDGMEIDGEVKEGGTVTVTAWGKVANPETNAAEVKNIVFKVYKGSKGGSPFTQSDPIAVTDPISDTDKDTGEPIYRYSASWSYTVPEADEYWIEADIACGRESSEAADSLPEGREEENSFFGGILDTVSNFFRNLFGLGGEESVTYQNQGDIPQVTVVVPTGSRTLQLGTFLPDGLNPSPTPLVEEACHEVHFVVQ